MKNPKVYAVIMAGGVGSRFWPSSREKTPKQLLEISGSGTMIQNTVRRLDTLVEINDVFVVTNRLQKNGIMKQLPEIPADNILVEPIGRNTAPCIGLAALFVHRLDPDAVMIVLPADHVIQDIKEFLRVLISGIQVAHESSALVTIGIKPTRPETGYGYVQFLDEDEGANRYFGQGAFKVKTFAEKPTVQVAEQFLRSGDFLWNSGMFIWRADVILKEIRHSLPEMYQQLKTLEPSIGTSLFEHNLEQVYSMIRGVSIDYGVMEKAKDVFVLKGDFGWNDLGSWDEVYRIAEKDELGNSVKGSAVLHRTKNSYIRSSQKMIATVGVEDLIIIETEDSIMVCKRGESQSVKEIVDYLRRKQMNEFL